jgi:hypothetical protein
MVWLMAVAPAHAYQGWQHGTAVGKRSCTTGCHAGQPPTNATCTRCHSGFATTADRWCWTCHEPGQSTSGWQVATGCTASCHLWTAVTESPSYVTSFAHAQSVHLGAAGYDKSCIDCHGVSLGTAAPGTSPHHDAVDRPPPACATCHDGVIASAPGGHDAFGDVCATCHDGMDRPSGECAACHVGVSGSSIPQIDYTNDLACADAACHGALEVHSGAPVDDLPCTVCHSAHYAELALCEVCHPEPRSYHHDRATAWPLADCSGCHDGGVAVGQASHGTVPCVLCHVSMDRPDEPAVCLQCHFRGKFGAAVCTTCHAETGLAGMEQVHTATPAAGFTCARCHDGHLVDLGTCDSCHGRAPEVHHNTATILTSTLTLWVSPDSVVPAGAPALVLGSLKGSRGAPVAGASVLLQESRLGREGFADVVTLFTDGDGGFSLPVTPVRGAVYRAVFRGLPSAAAVQEPALAEATVRVAQSVTLNARPAGARKGARVKLWGAAAPTTQQLGASRPAVTLRVDRKRGSRWVKVASVDLKPKADGSFSWTWRPALKGSYRVTASAAASAELLAATAQIRVRVR